MNTELRGQRVGVAVGARVQAYASGKPSHNRTTEPLDTQREKALSLKEFVP
jgi:hypothetical protein